MNSADPWKELASSDAINQVNVRRIDASHPWGLYWGRNRVHRLLLARLNGSTRVPARLPRFSGVRLTADTDQSGHVKTMMLELLDDQAEDVFLVLCQDIVGATRGSTTEQGLVEEMIRRTWMWHRLLETGRSELLTIEEQRGLIGELSVLKELCIPAGEMSSAVSAWTGPLGAARDFEFGAICLEVKARRPASLPFVAINSEYQLDADNLDTLYLVVVEVSVEAAPFGASLNGIVDNLRDLVRFDGEARGLLDERLMASGFRATDDYSEWHWSVGGPRIFRVDKGFPSLCASALPPGISRVKYSLSLKQCESFEVTRTHLERVLGRTMNGR